MSFVKAVSGATAALALVKGVEETGIIYFPATPFGRGGRDLLDFIRIFRDKRFAHSPELAILD
jgi:hypothetical protein